jgi:thiol-disulfide isomerase/thioredoxin
MKDIIDKSLKTAISYEEYKSLVSDLMKEGKSTGPVQNESRANYTKLNNQRMKRLDKQTRLSEEAVNVAGKVNKDFTWLVLTESWCGDAAQTLPVINKFSEANKNIDLKVVLRDENDELMDKFLTNGSKSIPKLIVIENNSKEVVSSWGPRTEKATRMIQEYKEKHGKVDDIIKKDLQVFYNQDKGKQIEKEMVSLLSLIVEG